MIYTFYSYKGGVGRSMALANIAELFYERGNKVVMIDWDLEAPGLERFFPVDPEEVQKQPGIIDMLLEAKEMIASGKTAFKKPQEYMISISPVNLDGGKLWLIPAGRRAKGNFSTYAEAVLTFDWQDFYANWSGEQYFRWLIEQLHNFADVILVDSRTGITEMSGICTYQLADVVVMLCTTNQQNINGTLRMARNLTREEVRHARSERPLEVLIIPSRVEDRAEIPELNNFRDQFEKEFQPFIPRLLSSEFTSFIDLEIPYIPHYAFNEIVAVREKGQNRAPDMEKAFTKLLGAMRLAAGEVDKEKLQVPTGAVKLSDAFYIERDVDNQVRRQITMPGSITTIRGARYSGKSSLLARAIDYARQQGAEIVKLDFQQFDWDILATKDSFLRYVAESVVRRLRLESQLVDEAWSGTIASREKLTLLLEELILPNLKSRLVLAMDDVDRLLETDHYIDFFNLLRIWYNSAAYNEHWERLNIIMTISAEPLLLIADINQSPFNVGLVVYLDDFTEGELQELNHRYGPAINDRDLLYVQSLLNGHPYLCRQALSTLTKEQMNWADFEKIVTSDEGPFGEHLRQLLQRIRQDKKSLKALQNVVHLKNLDDEMSVVRLLRMGLIKGRYNSYTIRCELYRKYFKHLLH